MGLSAAELMGSNPAKQSNWDKVPGSGVQVQNNCALNDYQTKPASQQNMATYV
jgi:hypothetical protein